MFNVTKSAGCQFAEAHLVSDDMKDDGLGCLQKMKLFIIPFTKVVGMLHLLFSWLPFPFGQVRSHQVYLV